MSRAVLHFGRGKCAHGKPDIAGAWDMPSCENVKLRLRWVELQRGMESQHHRDDCKEYDCHNDVQYGTSNVLK